MYDRDGKPKLDLTFYVFNSHCLQDALRNKMEKELDENNESDAKFLTRFKRAGYVESMCNLLVTLRKLHDRYDKL